MPGLITISPDRRAVKHLAAKTVVASPLRTAGWDLIRKNLGPQLALRAQFSAGVESTRFLSSVQNKLMTMVQMKREQLANGNEAFVSPSDFISDLRQIALQEGLQPQDGRYGGLQDPTSLGRLKLIHDVQVEQAQGYAQYVTDQSEGALDAYPAQELVRVEPRNIERPWLKIWESKGKRPINGRMIALKTDPIWIAINRFGVPFAPFDFNSGMGLEDVSREEAESLGLIKPGQKLKPNIAEFNDNMQASVSGLSDKWKNALSGIFGDQITVDGDSARWNATSGRVAGSATSGRDGRVA